MLSVITQFATDNVAAFGYGGVVFLMGLESANLPIPSEIVLPYAGFLAAQGKLDFHLAALAGAVGCLWGSVVSYWIGRLLGRPLIEKYGAYVMIGPKQLKLGDRFVEKHGQAGAFVARLLPVMRTFISFIAGVWRLEFWKFIVLAFIGSWIWSYLLVFVGWKLGENWSALQPLWHKFDAAIVTAGAAVVIAYVIHHIRGGRH